MIAHSGIGMRIRGLLKYLGPITVKENFRIYLFGDVTTILNEGILCYEFSGFEKNRSETSNNSFKKKSEKEKDFSYPVIRYHSPIYSLSEFLGHPLMGKMDLLDIPHFNAPLRYLGKSIVTIHDIIPFQVHSSFLKRIYMRIV
ncbi:glycosyltransferase family 1 protein, partial [Leptospira interrogans serovar Pomona]|nr:glycosyltransferase family 1 protein [Leptospira interrogans serovar Pomona]